MNYRWLLNIATPRSSNDSITKLSPSKPVSLPEKPFHWSGSIKVKLNESSNRYRKSSRIFPWILIGSLFLIASVADDSDGHSRWFKIFWVKAQNSGNPKTFHKILMFSSLVHYRLCSIKIFMKSCRSVYETEQPIAWGWTILYHALDLERTESNGPLQSCKFYEALKVLKVLETSLVLEFLSFEYFAYIANYFI